MMTERLNELLEPCIALAKQAGEAIVRVAQSADIGVKKKADKTPVTLADIAAHNVICKGLAELAPDIPVISEEGDEIAVDKRLSWPRCWLVDPLDGTRGFIDGSGEYTVNIALIDNHRPVMGVIYAPQLGGKLYYAIKGQGAFVSDGKQTTPIHSCAFDGKRRVNIAVSQYHSSAWLKSLLLDLPDHELVRMNSSIKICFVGDGVADIYPRLGPTSEWDTAAGQCVVEEAGGLVVDLDGQPLSYNARDTLLNPGFAVIGDPQQKDYFLKLIQRVRREK
ncbi:MAG: 3'(2'),5'-bisphosphate nucleotidase [Coxiella sp. (in: Bacteria)]|nr:MAG: 3'(2'),5'-bisphosphate nucleotidase [Coxiella sp. (in: g-proteobacteria)]